MKGGKIDASAHLSTAYAASRGLGDVIGQDEWCVFEELTQVESSYSLKKMSLIHPLVLAVMAGEEKLTNEISLHNNWIKLTSPKSATICQIRRALKFVFASFCENPHHPPSGEAMQFLDLLNTLIVNCFNDLAATEGVAGDGGGGVKGGFKGGKKVQQFEKIS